MKKRLLDKKLVLSRETVRNLMTAELRLVVGGSDCTDKPTRGALSACDCSTSATASDTCDACSTVQW